MDLESAHPTPQLRPNINFKRLVDSEANILSKIKNTSIGWTLSSPEYMENEKNNLGVILE